MSFPTVNHPDQAGFPRPDAAPMAGEPTKPKYKSYKYTIVLLTELPTLTDIIERST